MSTRYGLLIDYEFCTGCHSCEVACKQEHGYPEGQWGIKVMEIGPWQISDSKWQYSYVPVPTDLCMLCTKRVNRGKLPACVHNCNANVMKFGPVEDLAKEMAGRFRSVIFAPK